MKNGITTWFATTAFAGLAIALSNAGTVIAQRPGFGPGGPDGPGRGGPPNVAELFSRMDQNNDGKLSQDEVPEPLWNHLSHADADNDRSVTKDEAAKAMSGRRPDGPRPDGPRLDGPRLDAARPDDTHSGPAPFSPDAIFGRLDKNGDGSLSRDEFQAVAEFHRSQHGSPGPQGFGGHPGLGGDRGPSAHHGPSGPPMAHRGPGMPGGGPPWAHDGRGSFPGPQRFQGGPPWVRPSFGAHFNGRFAGPPPWASMSPQGVRGPHDGDRHEGPRHRDAESRDHNPRGEQRSPSRHPDPRDRSDASAPQSDAEVTADESPSASPSDDAITSSTTAKSSKVATVPL